MPKQKTKVFLDANVLISGGKPPGGPEIARVIDLVEAGLVSILTTDLTITEVSKKHASNDFTALQEILKPHFRTLLEQTTGIKLPSITRPELRDALRKKYDADTGLMFDALKANILSIDQVKPSTIFDAYSNGTGFFGEGAKKNQFPDAFTFECLTTEASKNAPVIIVSNDDDFRGPVDAEDHVYLVKSLPELFTELGLEFEAPQVEEFLDEQVKVFTSLVNDELADWGLQGDVEDSYIEDTNVNEAEILKFTAFKPTALGDPILVVGSIAVRGTAAYSHPDWDHAMYDSEDKVLVPFETVSGEMELDLEIGFSMSIAVDEDGAPAEIEELRFTNDDRWTNVVIHQADEYW